MKLLFLGDFLYDYKEINNDILEISKYIKENDLITILNFEGAFRSKDPYKKMVNLFCTKESLEVLKLLNVRAVNLANNHVMDFSKKGLENLLIALDKAGIGHFGAGLNKQDSMKPFIIEQDNQQIYFYGFGWNMEECINAKGENPGTAPLDFKEIDKIIRKREAQHLIFSFHFGYEYEKLPQPYHFKKCREIARNKRVKAIIGHHPHVVQGYDLRNNIFYSLGNFYFGTRRRLYDENFKYYPDVNLGIGVILDTRTWKSKIIKFKSFNEETVIDNDVEIKNLIDTCRIAVHEYPKYFKKHNNTINKRYVYKMGNFHEKYLNKTHYIRRNIYKFYLRKIKWPLGKKVKKILNFRKEK